MTLAPGTFRSLIVCMVLLATGACKPAPRAAPHPQVGWRPIGSWMGRGDTQTESFDIGSTEWRIKWETKGAPSPGAGSFHLEVHSAVSGRPLSNAIDHPGNGSGIAYVTEEPRLYELVINSRDVDWSIAVEEAVVGEVRQAR
ncbi:MAG TPA: hypothetical protein VMU80_12520 [Bryobacteraceae bacterium]|nr:hypothetical protein [Bryobacteraceae bacterium]HUO30035.1 hypothetical protein [Bryobacteraceae bacterium]